MPQTRFVLKKALALNLVPIIVVNKVDRPNARPYEVVDEVLELFMDLDATDEQLDSPVIYASGRDGWASMDAEATSGDMKPLFDLILKHVPAPKGDASEPFQMLVSNIDFDGYTGRIAVGTIERGTIKTGSNVTVSARDGKTRQGKIAAVYTYEGLKRSPAESAGAGEVVCLSGITDIEIGETLCDPAKVEPLPFVEIDQPVMSMTFSINNSPFAGREGSFVTSRHLRERLYKELESNISLRVEDTDSADSFVVSGRGELHLSVLIENMRRQGYEFQVSRPQVIFKTGENDEKLEPIEDLFIDVPDEYTGAVMESSAKRKAELTNMVPIAGGYTRLEFNIPSRGLIGYRTELLTATKGTAVINSMLKDYEPYKGDIPERSRGSLIAFETGEAVTYGLFNAQDRGTLFIKPGDKVYEGMIVGENCRVDDVVVNVCKKKHITNTRASGSDDALKLTPPKDMSLEQCLEFITADELLEVTPESLRLRKRLLTADQRAKADHRAKLNADK